MLLELKYVSPNNFMACKQLFFFFIIVNIVTLFPLHIFHYNYASFGFLLNLDHKYYEEYIFCRLLNKSLIRIMQYSRFVCFLFVLIG